MGMDYRYAGSASYPRFDEELGKLAELLGGKKTSELKDLEEKVANSNWVTQMFGTISSDDNIPKFVFPDGTADVIIKLCNHPYGDFTVEETHLLRKEFEKHPEIQKISNQIWSEVETLDLYEEAWMLG